MSFIETCMTSPAGACFSIEKDITTICSELHIGREAKNLVMSKKVEDESTQKHKASIRVLIPAAALGDLSKSDNITGAGFLMDALRKLDWKLDVIICQGHDDDAP